MSNFSASSLKQQSAGRLSSFRPVFVLTPWCCILSGEETPNINFKFFGLTIGNKKVNNITYHTTNHRYSQRGYAHPFLWKLWKICIISFSFYFQEGPLWSYGNWIYNYLCSQCLPPLMLWVRIYSVEVYLIWYYMIKFVNDLPQVGSFLWVLWFPPPIKLNATL